MLLDKILLSNLMLKYYLPLKFRWRQLTKQLEPEILWLEKIIEPNKRAIDIGANEGIYSYQLSKICQAVEAFEPQTCVAPLAAYSKLKGACIRIYPVALSDNQGLKKLYIPFSSKKTLHSRASLEERAIDCRSALISVRRLDDYNFNDVSFIKIDVEGHEQSVIQGGLKTIQKNQPILLIEIEQRWLRSSSIEDVFDQVRTLGYRGYFLDDKKWTSISSFSYTKHQQAFLLDVDKHFAFKKRKYINNFLFIPESSQSKKILELLKDR